MFIFGIVVGIALLMVCVINLMDENWLEAFVTTLGLLFCIIMVMVDVTSPVELTERIVMTNDYDAYGLYIESDKLGNVRIVETEPTRPCAILHDGVEYTFLSFVE